MAFKIPTTQSINDSIISNIEGRLNQTTPLQSNAFNRVLSAALALCLSGVYKYAADRAKQSLAKTALGDDLKAIGADRGVVFKDASFSIVEADITGSDGVSISSTIPFISSTNGLRYFPTSSQIIAGGVATLSLKCEEAGASGNLNNGDTLSIGAQVSNAATFATVTSTSQSGADEEPDESYRLRVLTSQRAKTGGGNYADYRIWAEETSGVKRAYPYSGRPITFPGTPSPPERTVYIEAQSSIDVDGIAPQYLLDDVRAMITTDPVTGYARQPAGLTDDTLYVESISVLSVNVMVENLVVDPSKDAKSKQDISDAVSLYFSTVTMFISGLDYEGDRSDTISIASIGGIVNDALRDTGGTVTSVKFGFDLLYNELRYQLRPGEKLKVGVVDYA